MPDTFYCPRRDDMTRSMIAFSGKGGLSLWIDPELEVGGTPNEDRWVSDRGRDRGYRHCTYCGSLEPSEFLAAVLAGAEVGPTDKGYKVYIDLPEPAPDELRVVSAITWDPGPERVKAEGWLKVDRKGRALLKRDGWGDSGYLFYRLTARGRIHHDKFYLQHIAHPGLFRQSLYDLVNAGKVKVGYPGHFYSGLLGMRQEHLARHPEAATEAEQRAIDELRARMPEVMLP